MRVPDPRAPVGRLPRMAYEIAEAAEVSATSEKTVRIAIAKGELEARKLGRKYLILARDLRRWLNGLPKSGVGDADSEAA